MQSEIALRLFQSQIIICW